MSTLARKKETTMDNLPVILVQISGPKAAAMQTMENLLETNTLEYLSMGTAEHDGSASISIYAKAPAH